MCVKAGGGTGLSRAMQLRLVDQGRQGLTAIGWPKLAQTSQPQGQKPRGGSFLNPVSITQSLLTGMGTEDLSGHSSERHTAASGVFMGFQPGVPLEKGSAVERNVLWAELTPGPLAGPC